jgi:hypothetical protein
VTNAPTYTDTDTGIIALPIKLGAALVTLVEPRPGHVVDFNRWYEEDHFYAGCMASKFNFAGARFVATKADKAKRFPADSPVPPAGFGLESGSYVAIYWILDGYFDEWNRWAVDQVNYLHANGRMFSERDHIHTLMYEIVDEFHGSGSGRRVPAELTLDHHFPAISIIIGEVNEGVDPATAVQWFDGRLGPAETTIAFTPRPLLGDAPGDIPRDLESNRFLLLSFYDGDPHETWDATVAPLEATFAAADLGRIVWAGPFRATVPGTDRYTDEL